MNETTKLLGVLAVGAALGAGGVTASTDTFDTSSRPVEIRFLPDGQTAVAYTTKIGDCVSQRELVYGVDGGVRLNGRPTDDATAKQLAASIAEARQVADSIDPKIADRVVAVRYLGDGQTALTLQKALDGGTGYAELVVGVDGGAPRLNGIPLPEGSAKITTDALRSTKETTARVSSSVLTEPLEVAAEPPPPETKPTSTDLK